MAILDTFFLLFESDTKGLDEGLADARKAGKATAKELEGVDKAARKMGESIGRSIKELGGMVTGFFAAKALADSFFAAGTAADHLNESAGRLDVGIETLGMWGDAVTLVGGSLDGLIGSVENFNGMLATMEVTGKSRAAPFLKELGIDLENVANKGKTAFELLPDIAHAMEGMGKQQSAAIGRKLGLDPGTIMLLQQGGRELDEMIRRQKELGVVTKEQGEVADKFGDQMDDSRHALRSLWLEISLSVTPALTWLAKKFEQVAVFMRVNKGFIVGLMIAIGSAVAVFAIPPLLSMAAAALAALAPFLLIAAAVAAVGVAFALIYDDVMNFIDGNDSLIGQFLTEFPVVAETLRNIGVLFEWLASVVTDVAQIIGAVLGAVFNTLWTLASDVIGFFVGRIEYMGEMFKGVGALIVAMLDFWIVKIGEFLDKFGGVMGIIKAVGGAISGTLGSVKAAVGVEVKASGVGQPGASVGGFPKDQKVPGVVQPGVSAAQQVPGLSEGKNQLAAAGSSPIAAMSSNAISNSATTNKNTTITVGEVKVQTQATDSAGIAKTVGDSLGAQLRQAASNYDDGVAA